MEALHRRGTVFTMMFVCLVASVCLSAGLYLLLRATNPPPPYGHPGAPTSIRVWTESYASWSQASQSYGLDFALSLLAPFSFLAALGVMRFPRAAFVTSFSLLNLFFAWSSHVIASISFWLQSGLTQAVSSQDFFLLTSLRLFLFTGNAYVVADAESLALLAGVVASAFLLGRDRGRRRALVLSTWAASLCLVILGIEIAVFDYRELFLHVTQAQVVLDLAPWFSNADLLFSALLVFSLASLSLRRPWSDR